MFRKTIITTFITLFIIAANPVFAANYVIDTKGAHASIKFKISHLGYSWLYGGFKTFSGDFNYDEKNPSTSQVSVKIDTSSVDTNHAERDKHLRSADFLNVKKYPKAGFVSTSFQEQGNKKVLLKGKLTLNGVTRPISIEVLHVGAGRDPWGGYRRGFEGRTTLTLTDWNINKNLGPASGQLEMMLDVEGIRQ